MSDRSAEAFEESLMGLAEMRRRLAVAEAQLGVAAGVLQNLYYERENIAAIKMTGTIEPMLSDWIREALTAPLGGLGGVPPQERFGELAELAAGWQLTQKITVAQSLNILDTDQKQFIDALNYIRNRYAHHVRNAEKSMLELIAEGSDKPGQRDQKVKALTFGEVPSTEMLPDDRFFVMVIWGFSEFLNRAELRRPRATEGLWSLLGVLPK